MDARYKMSGMTALGMEFLSISLLKPSDSSGHDPRKISLSHGIFNLGSDPSPNLATIDELGAKLGLELAKLKSEMETPEIAQSLTRNHVLAAALGIQSTPTFVMGGSPAGGIGCEVPEFNRPSRGQTEG